MESTGKVHGSIYDRITSPMESPVEIGKAFYEKITIHVFLGALTRYSG